MKKIVIIPAYNEQGSILNTIEDIRKNAPDFDYVVINDCSKDDTLKLCLRSSNQPWNRRGSTDRLPICI